MLYKFLKICSLINLIAFSSLSLSQESEQEISSSEPSPEVSITPTENSEPEPDTSVAPTPNQELPVQSTSQIVAKKQENEKASEKRIFGSYEMNISINRIRFTEIAPLYDKFYGSPSDHITLGVDWYPFDFWITAGLGAKIGFFSDSGSTSTNRRADNDNSGASVKLKENSKSQLIMYPFQFLLKVQATPFSKKYVKFAGWGGVEYAYWRETKLKSDEDKKTLNKNQDEEEKTLSTNGTKDNIVIGGALHLLLNPLDETSVNSMNDTLGIGSVYLSPFYEIIKQRNASGMNLSRQVIGLGFSFETIR